MDPEHIDSSECAPMAIASTSKHHTESSEEEEPSRKIQKLSGALSETTSQEELPAEVLSTAGLSTGHAAFQSDSECFLDLSETEDLYEDSVYYPEVSVYYPVDSNKREAVTNMLLEEIASAQVLDTGTELQAATLSNVPSAGHAVLQNDSDQSDWEFSDEEIVESEARYKEGKERAVRAVTLMDPNLINVQDSYGRTPLHRAASYGYGKVVKMLLDKGAKTDIQDKNGRTPLHGMVCGKTWGTGRYEYEVYQDTLDERYVSVMKKLLAAGANAHLQDKRGRTPLHIALINDNKIGAEMIVDAKGGNNLQDERGKTPLHLAMQHDWLEIAKKLLTAGVSTRIRDNKGRTPLHVALDRRDNSIANNFVDADSENDLQDPLGRTPLHFTAKEGRIIATRKLLYCGAHPHIKAKTEDWFFRETEEYPLGVALRHRRSIVAKMILAACVLRGIVIDWDKDLNWREIPWMVYEDNNVEFYQDLCVEFDIEVQKMKDAKLCGTTISYYDFATKHERKLAPYLRNKDICSLLRSIDFDDHFPTYGRLITFKIKRARKRNTLIASCLKCFSVLTKKFPSLLKINTDPILNYLNERDMINFVEAFNIKS